MECKIPAAYASGPNALHRDWIWPLSLIPRKATGYCASIPFKKLFGNAPITPHIVQTEYPLAPIPTYWKDGVVCVDGPHPVHDRGQWSIQAVWSRTVKMWIPCFMSFTLGLTENWNFHYNGSPLMPLAPFAIWLVLSLSTWWLWSVLGVIAALLLTLVGLKPDMTFGDWFGWFEFSGGFRRVKKA